ELLVLAGRTYQDLSDVPRPYLTDKEVRYLTIPKGSLDEAERLEIESHVNHTYSFLKEIPWTRELHDIPLIAYGHHEKLDGHGYPRGVTGDAIPVQTRMMTISDIYDALTAADRPYKPAVAPARVLERAPKPDGEQQRPKRCALRGVLGQPGKKHEARNDEDGAPDPEQPGYHAGREADQTHQHPVHRASPCSGFPHAPPPGVSMWSTSPGASSVFTLDATGVPFKIVRPAAPCPPSAAPAGSWRRRSASTLSSIGASASNSRTTPSPPAHRPTPPLPRRKA